MKPAQASRQELMIHTIARLLLPCRSIAVGAASPIPGAGALLAKHWAANETPARRLFLTILGSGKLNSLTSGGVELFDMAAQGRVDAFFLSGGQIDGQGNINLVGAGGAYPQNDVRWSGSFGSAYLYYLVPRVILFREEHTRRVMVPRVDFISAPGPRDDGVYRPGGPLGLLTNLCWFAFDKTRRRFRLETVHPGHTTEEVRDNTGFEFDVAPNVPATARPDAVILSTIRGPIAREIGQTYPRFVKQVFPDAA
jgi:glutaconate CoA-transferase subunit B